MPWPKGKPRPKKVSPEAEVLVNEVVDSAIQAVSTPVAQATIAPTSANQSEPPKRTFSQPSNKWGMKNADWGSVPTTQFEESSTDPLHIPLDQIPEGMDMMWVSTGSLGKDDPKPLAQAEKNHWRVVHNQDFGGLYEGKWARKGEDAAITYENLVLVARPLEFSLEARKRDARTARAQAELKMGSLISGQIPGVTGAGHSAAVSQNRINRSVERIQVPED